MPALPDISAENIGRIEALLLLYLLGELSAEEAGGVEKLVATDASARTMLEQLRIANDAIGLTLKRSDERTPISEFELASIARRTSRAMSRQHVDQIVHRAEPAAPPRWRPSFRVFGAVAASIAVLIGLMIYWGNHVNTERMAALPQSTDGSDANGGGATATDQGGGGGNVDGRPFDRAAFRAADGLASAIDVQGFAGGDKGVNDAEAQFERLREVTNLGRNDSAALTSQ